MIFIGNGALLKSAIEYTLNQGYAIDGVFVNSGELESFFVSKFLKYFIVPDVNKKSQLLSDLSSDGIVFSINNGTILKQNLLDIPGFKFYNIHNGLVQKYRGLPEICVFYAILDQEKEYGVTLHQINEKIDAGHCIDQLKFSIEKHFTFQNVMFKSLNLCDNIFKNNLHKIMKGEYCFVNLDRGNSQLFSYKNLSQENMMKIRELDTFEKARKLGIYKLWFKRLDNILNQIN